MLTLTREVRFAIPFSGPPQTAGKPHNAYAGHPPLTGAGMYLRLEVTVAGELHPDSQYLVDIKTIDRAVRDIAIPFLATRLADFDPALLPLLLGRLSRQFTPADLVRLVLHLTPFQSWTILTEEQPMVRVSEIFEFSAAHRLHNPALSDEANRQLFGKCNNALGHGHNYQVQVTVRAQPHEVLATPDLERIVEEHLIRHFDHKHLNLEVPDFKDTLASVENIARAAYRRLKPALPSLTSITIWETPKTWAEYSE